MQFRILFLVIILVPLNQNFLCSQNISQKFQKALFTKQISDYGKDIPSFFRGYDEIYIVGEHMHIFSKNAILDNLKFDSFNSYFQNHRTFAPSILGIKYLSNDTRKKYIIRKSRLWKNNKILDLIENQNAEYRDHRLTVSTNDKNAIGYTKESPNRISFFMDVSSNVTQQFVYLEEANKGEFVDLQISDNGTFAIVVFSNKSFLFQIKKREASLSKVLELPVPRNEYSNFIEGSFVTITNDGVVFFHYPNSPVYQFNSKGKLKNKFSLSKVGDQYLSACDKLGENIFIVSKDKMSDNYLLNVFNLKSKSYSFDVEIECKEPYYIYITDSKKLAIFSKSEYKIFSIPNLSINTKANGYDNLGRAYPLLDEFEFSYDPEKKIIYRGKEELINNVKSVERLNNFNDCVVNTESDGAYLFNLRIGFPVSEKYDTMWVDHFASVALFRQHEKYGYIYMDRFNKVLTEKITDYNITRSLFSGPNNRLFLEYKNEDKRGVLNSSGQSICEFKCDSLVIFDFNEKYTLFYKNPHGVFRPYDLESRSSLKYKYDSIAHLSKDHKKYLEIKRKDKVGLYSIVDQNEIIKPEYDAFEQSFKTYNALLLGVKKNSIDLYDKYNFQKITSDNNVDISSINIISHHGSLDYAYYSNEKNEWYVNGIHVVDRKSYPFKFGPFEGISSVSRRVNLHLPEEIKLAEVLKDESKYILYLNGKLELIE